MYLILLLCVYPVPVSVCIAALPRLQFSLCHTNSFVILRSTDTHTHIHIHMHTYAELIYDDDDGEEEEKTVRRLGMMTRA